VLQKVLPYIRDLGLMRAGDRVVAAVSGGADSVALLRLLLELRAELGIVLAVAHFNHGLRAQESEADQAFVTDLSRHHRLEFFAGRGDVRGHASTSKLGIEAAGRELRYAWFTQLAGEQSFDSIATAHTLDDQAETVLLKFLRGAGTRGVAGIYPSIEVGNSKPCRTGSDNDDRQDPSREAAASVLAAGVSPRSSGKIIEPRSGGTVRIVRPLLCITRDEVVAYLTSIGQTWREDESNLDHRFARNRVRHQLLPLLARDYNPNILRALNDTAEVSRAEEEYWQGLVERELELRQPPEPRDLRTEIPPGLKPGVLATSNATAEPVAEKLGRMHGSGRAGLQARVQVPYFCHPERTLVREGSVVPSFSATSEAVSFHNHVEEKRLSLANFQALPLALQRRLLRGFAASQGLTLDFEHVERLLRCAIGGLPRTELPGGWLASRRGECLQLCAPAREPTPAAYQYTLAIPGEVRIAELDLTLRAIIVRQEFARESGEADDFLSADLLGPELTVRNWCPGDRFWPVHCGAEEKLKRLFAKRKIPQGKRTSWPVVLVGNNIVWVRDFPIARAYAWNGRGDAVRIDVAELLLDKRALLSKKW
jgi:tRNA(Ile)-lysidine synthase